MFLLRIRQLYNDFFHLFINCICICFIWFRVAGSAFFSSPQKNARSQKEKKMRTYYDDFNYDQENKNISFDGDIVVDVSQVPQQAKATIYSGVTADFDGFETEFQVNASKRPFDLKITTLSPTGLIKAIVENRLEVEGMLVSNAIQRAYTYLETNNTLQ